MRELTLEECQYAAGGHHHTYECGWGSSCDWVDDVEVTGPGSGGGWSGPGIPSGPPPEGGGSGSGHGFDTDGLDPDPQCGPDSAAREALALFLADAASMNEFYGHRERGAFIIQNPDGSYALSGFEVGPSVFSAEGAQVALNTTGVTPQNVIGFVHNHPSGPTLSGPDRDILTEFQNYLYDNGVDREFRMYMIDNSENIYVFDKDNMNNPLGVNVTAPC